MASKRRNTVDMEYGKTSLDLARETAPLKNGGVSIDNQMENATKHGDLLGMATGAATMVTNAPASLIRGQMAPATRTRSQERQDVFNKKKSPTWTNSFRIG